VEEKKPILSTEESGVMIIIMIKWKKRRLLWTRQKSEEERCERRAIFLFIRSSEKWSLWSWLLRVFVVGWILDRLSFDINQIWFDSPLWVSSSVSLAPSHFGLFLCSVDVKHWVASYCLKFVFECGECVMMMWVKSLFGFRREQLLFELEYHRHSNEQCWIELHSGDYQRCLLWNSWLL